MNSNIRNAATLIICSKINNASSLSDSYNYKVILLKRSSGMKVASNRMVFPGGAYEKSDESLKWLKVFFKNHYLNNGNSSENLVKTYFANILFTNNHNINRPNLFMNNYDKNKQLPPEISYRLCAIRETFEETGLLLAHKIDNGCSFLSNTSAKPKQFAHYVLDRNIVQKWHSRVTNDASEFINMFLELNIIPDLLALHEWSNWLTPIQEKIRFDTMFFICFLNNLSNETKDFYIDLNESQKLEFYNPTETLNDYSDNKITLLPPQITEFTRLTKYKLIEELAEYSLNRQSKGGVTRWMPKFVKINDEKFGLLPGDDYYELCDNNSEISTKEKKLLINKNRFLRFNVNNETRFKLDSNMLFNDIH